MLLFLQESGAKQGCGPFSECPPFVSSSRPELGESPRFPGEAHVHRLEELRTEARDPVQIRESRYTCWAKTQWPHILPNTRPSGRISYNKHQICLLLLCLRIFKNFKLSNQGNWDVKCKTAECFQNLIKEGLFSKTAVTDVSCLNSPDPACLFLVMKNVVVFRVFAISEALAEMSTFLGSVRPYRRYKCDVMSLIKPLFLNRMSYVNKDRDINRKSLKSSLKRSEYVVQDLRGMRLKGNIPNS